MFSSRSDREGEGEATLEEDRGTARDAAADRRQEGSRDEVRSAADKGGSEAEGGMIQRLVQSISGSPSPLVEPLCRPVSANAVRPGVADQGGLGLEAQRRAVAEFCEREGLGLSASSSRSRRARAPMRWNAGRSSRQPWRPQRRRAAPSSSPSSIGSPATSPSSPG